MTLARDHAQATIELAEEYGFGQLGTIGRVFAGWADARTGTSRDALASIQASVEDLAQARSLLAR